MATAVLSQFQRVLFSADRRVSAAAMAALLIAAAALVAIAIAVLGPALAMVLAFGLVAAYLVLRSVQWGLVFVIFVACLLPFAAMPFRLGFKPTFLDIALAALVFVWAVRLITGREQRFVGSPMGLAVAIFLFVIVFSFALGSSNAQPSVTTVRRFAEVVGGVLMFFVVVNIVREQPELEAVGRALLVAGALAALIGVVFYAVPEAWTVRALNALARFDYPGGYGALRYIEDDPNNPMRAIGTAIDPNTYGGMLILFAGLSAPQLVARRPLFPRWLVGLMFAVEAMCLYLTYSRSAMIGLAVAVLLVGILRYRRLVLVALVGLALLLILPQAQAYVVRFLEGVQGQDLATQMRFGEYKDALELITRYPVFGVGFSGTPDIDLYIGVSNVYLLIAEQAGLVGLAAFLLCMAILMVAFVRTVRAGMTDDRREALLLGLGGAIAGVLVSGLLDHYLFNLAYPHMVVLFWIYAGLAMAAILIERSQPAVSPAWPA